MDIDGYEEDIRELKKSIDEVLEIVENREHELIENKEIFLELYGKISAFGVKNCGLKDL